MIQVIIGDTDARQLLKSATWSGDVRQCARTLAFSLLSSPSDAAIPTVPCELGAPVFFYQDGTPLFDGFIFARTKSTSGSAIDVTCYDRGIYLKRNKTSVKFVRATPEDIARRIAGDFGITVGALAETGVKISRNFIGCTLYDIIQTSYTLASAQTGVKYQTLFKLDRLCVTEKKAGEETLVIEGGSNLMDATATDSIENLVSRVAVYDDRDRLTQVLENSELVKLYGVMQEYVKTDVEKARKLLRDNGVSQKITVNCLGNAANTAGGTVAVREPYTGIYGLFYIDSDTHSWKNGIYTNKLALNLQNVMDEKEAGTLVSKTVRGGGAANGESSGVRYIYKNKPA